MCQSTGCLGASEAVWDQLQVVLCGDFHQLPPISDGLTKDQREVATQLRIRGAPELNLPFMNRGLAFEARTWLKAGFKVHQLSHVHRQDSAAFVSILHAIRQGFQTAEQIRHLEDNCCRLDHHGFLLGSASVCLSAINDECLPAVHIARHLMQSLEIGFESYAHDAGSTMMVKVRCLWEASQLNIRLCPVQTLTVHSTVQTSVPRQCMSSTMLESNLSTVAISPVRSCRAVPSQQHRMPLAVKCSTRT